MTKADAVEREPRWPALVAMLADGFVYLALPENLSVGPGWALLALLVVLVIPLAVSVRRKRYDISRVLTFGANGLITLAMIASLGLLIKELPEHKEPPGALLRSAMGLWITNVLVFAPWYWKLDPGRTFGAG